MIDPAPFRLLPAHHLIINGLGFLTALRLEDARTPMVIAELAEVARDAPWGHPLMDRAIAQAQHWGRMTGPLNSKTRGADYARLQLDTAAIAAELFFWRMGAAQAAMGRPVDTKPTP